MICLATLWAPFGFFAFSIWRAASETSAMALASTELTPLKSRVIPSSNSEEVPEPSGATVKAGKLFGTEIN